MHTEKEIREGLRDCKSEIKQLNERLFDALANNNDDQIAECAGQLGILGISYLTAVEILR